ncbi:ATP-grasp domain-containing protein [Azospirillum sp. ST 5-10]|uniref:ATP-grasp domain-containing protein n=1 Tax=unclassified Azospirillum TaxID=2630922 RepID=UPI003F49CF5E
MADRVVLFAESGDSWHVGRLVRAFRAAAVEPLVVSLQTVDVVVAPGSWGLRIPGLAGGPPDAALVRTVAGGGFEPVTLRLDVLHALGHLGVPVVNEARAIERCVDKAMTSFLLHRAGIPTPETWATADPERAAAALRRALDDGGALVQKPLFGSQGRDVRRLDRGDALVATDGVYYLQRFVAGAEGGPYRDWRVFVIGGRAVASMARIAGDWVTNVHRGARCEAVRGDRELEAMAEAAAAAVGAEVAGVDLIRDASGALAVLEVNSMPAWQGLQSVAGVDIAALVVEHVLGRIHAAAP